MPSSGQWVKRRLSMRTEELEVKPLLKTWALNSVTPGRQLAFAISSVCPKTLFCKDKNSIFQLLFKNRPESHKFFYIYPSQQAPISKGANTIIQGLGHKHTNTQMLVHAAPSSPSFHFYFFPLSPSTTLVSTPCEPHFW